MAIQITVWNEFIHEKTDPEVTAIYPDGIHNAIGNHLKKNPLLQVRTATLDQPEHGLTDDVLNNTDVLIWWAHVAHDKVDDAIVEKVYNRVQSGMGLIVLHSGHASKIFSKLCGTNTLNLKWREDGKKERLWVVEPSHPIARGIGDCFEIPAEEMYGERFDIPTPDDVVFISWFEGGEVFRSGVTFKRGSGKIFYFRPGHEAFPVYHQKEVLQVIENAALWAAPTEYPTIVYGHVAPRE